MKIAFDYFNFTIDYSESNIATLVIENPEMLRNVLSDFISELKGYDGPITVSNKMRPLSLSNNAELILNPLTLDINRKTLINKITARLVETSIDESNYFKSEELLAGINNFISNLQLTLDCNLELSKLSIDSLIKAIGISVDDNYDNLLERLLDYFGLVREFEGEKLFVIYGLKSLFSSSEIEKFFETICQKEYNVLLIEASSCPKLADEKVYIVDQDLCEIY